MAQAASGNVAQAVSQYPSPPKRYYEALADPNAPMPIPPAPPGLDGTYSMFGRVYSTTDRLPSLQESGRVCLYNESLPVCDELRRLNKLLIKLFHAFLVTLSTPSGSHENVVARIEDVFINMHHLLNTLRPAQAVRDLVHLLNRQTKSRQDATNSLRDAAARADKEIVDAALALQPPQEDDALNGGSGEETRAIAVVEEVLEKGASTDDTCRMKLAFNREWYHREVSNNDAKNKDKTSALACARIVTGKPNSTDVLESVNKDEMFDEAILAELERIKNDPNL